MAGKYHVRITGTFDGFKMGYEAAGSVLDSGMAAKLLEVVSFG